MVSIQVWSVYDFQVLTENPGVMWVVGTGQTDKRTGNSSRASTSGWWLLIRKPTAASRQSAKVFYSNFSLRRSWMRVTGKS